MITQHQLYAVVVEHRHGEKKIKSVLQLRTNIEPLGAHKFRRNDEGELVLQPPEPVIAIAHGPIHQLWDQAKLFFRQDLNWLYMGDGVHYALVQQKADRPLYNGDDE